MALDPTKPTDQVLVSEIPSYIRALTASLNTVVAGAADFITTELDIAGGTTALVIGTNLSTVKFETVLLSASGPATLDEIRGGIQGQIKLFILQNNNVTFKDGLKSTGDFYLNQLPVGSNFAAQIDDVICFINIDGNGSSDYGYWKEVFRQGSVK